MDFKWEWKADRWVLEPLKDTHGWRATVEKVDGDFWSIFEAGEPLALRYTSEQGAKLDDVAVRPEQGQRAIRNIPKAKTGHRFLELASVKTKRAAWLWAAVASALLAAIAVAIFSSRQCASTLTAQIADAMLIAGCHQR